MNAPRAANDEPVSAATPIGLSGSTKKFVWKVALKLCKLSPTATTSVTVYCPTWLVSHWLLGPDTLWKFVGNTAEKGTAPPELTAQFVPSGSITFICETVPVAGESSVCVSVTVWPTEITPELALKAFCAAAG